MKNYALGLQGREAIKFVAEQMGDILGKTLGPAGRNYFLPSGITNDGKTIAKQIEYATDNNPDEIKNYIASAFCEVAERQDMDAGDGTTTALVLATKLTETILDKVPDLDTPTPGAVPVMELSKQLDAEKTKALELLAKKISPVDSLSKLQQVAFTAMEDIENSKIIAETIYEAGKDAFPVIDEGFNGKVESSVIAGIRAPFAVAAPSMFNTSKKEAVYDHVPVLVVNHVFEAYRELSNFMGDLIKQPRAEIPALVIVAKQFSVSFINEVARTIRATNFPILLISNSNVESDVFEDVAAFCGAHLIDTHPKTGLKTSQLNFSYAGYVKKIIAGEKETVFIGGKGLELQNGTSTKVNERVMAIKQQMEAEKAPEKRVQMERRVAALQGGIATIYVDAKTAVDKYYLKLKVEDCMNSCRHALNSGMVRGGGLALKEVADELGPNSLLHEALYEPHLRIQRNAGGIEIAENIQDSFLVMSSAIENAVAVVKILITTEGIIAEVEPSVLDEVKRKLLG